MFMYPFHSAKFQKKSHSRSSLMMMRHFWAQNGPFAPKIFLENIIIIFITLLTPSIVQNLKKILTADPDS